MSDIKHAKEFANISFPTVLNQLILQEATTKNKKKKRKKQLKYSPNKTFSHLVLEIAVGGFCFCENMNSTLQYLNKKFVRK